MFSGVIITAIHEYACCKVSSSIRLLFPQCDSRELIAPLHHGVAHPKAKLKPMHVLFADDEAMIHEVFCAIFEDGGSQVDAFENGLQAWQQFQRQPDHYEVVVLDVSMPEMDGPEVARNIRNVSNVPIVLISGYDVHQTLSLVDGVDAMTQMRAKTPDLIILDLMMPNMDGLEATRLIRQDERVREGGSSTGMSRYWHSPRTPWLEMNALALMPDAMPI